MANIISKLTDVEIMYRTSLSYMNERPHVSWDDYCKNANRDDYPVAMNQAEAEQLPPKIATSLLSRINMVMGFIRESNKPIFNLYKDEVNTPSDPEKFLDYHLNVVQRYTKYYNGLIRKIESVVNDFAPSEKA